MKCLMVSVLGLPLALGAGDCLQAKVDAEAIVTVRGANGFVTAFVEGLCDPLT